MNRSVVVDDGLGYHAGNSASAAIAPLGTRCHHTGRLSARFLKSSETSRDIKLEVTAAATVASLDHDNNWLLIGA